MTPQEFIAKWQRANLSERSAAQQHFLDLCALLGQPTPAAADPDGAWYCFERGVRKSTGGKGWADVWMRERFAWEYKGKHKNLDAAYAQLQLYREDLENPPLLVVCDLNRFEVHTNFTNTVKQVHAFDLDGLAEPANLDILRKVFTQPEALKPKQTTAEVTQQVAERFAQLADGMRARNVPAERAGHFLMKLMFCMFAEDIGLLPEKLFTKVLTGSKGGPPQLSKKLKGLFEAMASGGEFGADTILHFNGGLFADADVEELTPAEIEELVAANASDWANVEPSIFGTLFERILDPAKRSQIGAHYTSKEDILTLLEPVLMAPLRREWEEVKAKAEKLWEKVQEAARKGDRKRRTESKARKDYDQLLLSFGERLEHVTVLDPACGSGNFLYVALHLLLDLEKQVISYASQHDLSWIPRVRPTQLAGIEINPYAQHLAQVVIWIGYLQWMHHNGFLQRRDPVLEPIENIRRMDAILDLSDPANPREPEWPAADFIVGNPPFLGDKKMRGELGDNYVDALRKLYRDRLPGQSDLCCYWFEKARAQIERDQCQRAGLLGTQGIRGGANRTALDRIATSGGIFWAYGDRDWILDGALVHVSMVGFDRGLQAELTLDGKPVTTINPDLTSSTDVTIAPRIAANGNLSFIGASMHGPFEITEKSALAFLIQPNVHGMPNSDLVRLWANAKTITQSIPDLWIVDVPPNMSAEQAALYESPFEYLRTTVLPVREKNRRPMRRRNWWLLGDPQKAMRAAIEPLERFVMSPRVSKHRLFVWANHPLLPTDATVVFAQADDAFLGLLHSRVHETWARAKGTQLREEESGFRYSPSACFETFPFPTPTAEQQSAIAAAAKELDTLRCNWLNPPEWTRQEVLEFPGSVGGPWARYVQDADSRGIGTVRYPRTVPKDEDCAKKLQKRTLTNLYNERPTWLDLAHQKLDAVVFAAYGWKPDMSDDAILAALLALNLERADKQREDKAGRNVGQGEGS